MGQIGLQAILFQLLRTLTLIHVTHLFQQVNLGVIWDPVTNLDASLLPSQRHLRRLIFHQTFIETTFVSKDQRLWGYGEQEKLVEQAQGCQFEIETENGHHDASFYELSSLRFRFTILSQHNW